MSRMAWRSSMKFERGVLCEQAAVAKKAVFSSINIAIDVQVRFWKARQPV
jgi:hypothetical protein